MRKLPIVLLILFCSSASFGQSEVGYNTSDFGATFQWYKDGKFIGIHGALNAKLHHSVFAEAGAYIAGEPTAAFYTNANKGGIGMGLGYRYYTMLRPHAFFVGVKANLFTNKVSLTTPTAESYYSAIFIPSFETGYMILINDQFFITPAVSIGYKTNLRSELKADKKKTVALLGISIGAKF